MARLVRIGLYADGETTGRLMVLHLHPWIMGQPWRIRHLDEVLGHICAHSGASGRRPVVRSSTGSRHGQDSVRTPFVDEWICIAGERRTRHDSRTWPILDYAPITERPVIRWPGSARVAFWVAPNMEFFE